MTLSGGAYRQLLASRQVRLLLAGLGVSSLGDGISYVAIAWLAVALAPPDSVGLFVGLALAAYTLPGVVGALVLGRVVRGRPARALVLVHCLLRATCLGLIALPFAVASIPVTVLFFGIGGIIYGPFLPLTYALFQSATKTENLPAVLAARSALIMVSTPLGTALGGPMVEALGGTWTLVASGVATVLLAAVGFIFWREPAADRLGTMSSSA